MVNTMFQGAVPLSSERHREHRLALAGGYGFAAKEAAVPLVAQEFAAAACEFPVAFLEREGEIFPVAMLGLKEGENLFVEDDGSWNGNYVPAVLRQFPFIMMRLNAETAVLAVVEEHIALAADVEGRRLFNSDGSLAKITQDVQAFLNKLLANSDKTKVFCRTLKDLDLLVPFRASAKSEGGQTRQISGLLTVDQKALRALKGRELEALNASGALELAVLQNHSLRNFKSLLKRVDAEISVEEEDIAEFRHRDI